MSPTPMPFRGVIRDRGRLLTRLLVLVAVFAVVPARGETPGVRDSVGGARDRAFMEEEMTCDSYVFPPGDFPAVRWSRPEKVRELVGLNEPVVTYYDREMKELSRADAPGRYAAVVRTSTADGFEVVRYISLFCTPAELDDYSPLVPLRLLPFTGMEIPAGAWERYAAETRRFSFGDLLMLPTRSADAAVFLAGMAEWDSTKGPGWTPRISDAGWWAEFKRRRSGAGSARIPDPEALAVPSPALRQPDLSATVFTAADVGNLRSLCRQWADEGGRPLVTLIAHGGSIVFHEGFAPGGGSAPVSTPMWMASITKLLTGVLVMMSAEQGMIGLDVPVSEYLVECAGRCPASLTPRRLMTHTADLGWSGDWASDWNHSLENQIAHVAPTLRIGERFEYTRAGCAVMGKVLERLSGLPVSTLLERCIVRPLGMRNAFVENSYGGLYCSALDLARLGQMLLNGGVYERHRFLSPASISAMTPGASGGSGSQAPGGRGIGTAPVRGPGLSASAFGHAAASGAFFCVDPELDLVIISARDRVGTDEARYKEFVRRLIECSTTPVKAGGTQ